MASLPSPELARTDPPDILLSNDRSTRKRSRDDQDTPRRAKKKQRPSTSDISEPPLPRKCRPKGKLSLLFRGAPFEIFAEIFSLLSPRDLLTLARLSKNLRSTLMCKTARAIWVAALASVPGYAGFQFPACPPDLSEPRYASLVFDPWCMHCNKGGAHSVDFGNRRRLCEPCKRLSKNRASRRSTLADFSQTCVVSGVHSEDLPAIFKLVPRSFETGFFCWVIACEIFEQCMVRKRRLCHAEYRKYLDERESAMNAVKEHSRLLDRWYRAYRGHKEKGPDIRQLVLNRQLEITERLLQAGWRMVDFPRNESPNQAAWKKMVCSQKPLTDQAWGSIKTLLERILANERTSRLASAPPKR